jgi:hypothetical protein
VAVAGWGGDGTFSIVGCKAKHRAKTQVLVVISITLVVFFWFFVLF